MAPMMASNVVEDDTFQQSVDALRGQYPHIDSALTDLRELLRCDYQLPQIAVSKGQNVYAVRMDYPALGANGVALFLVTYHATPARPGPGTPYKTITMLTISPRLRRGQPDPS